MNSENMNVQERKIKVIHAFAIIEAFIFQTHWNFCTYWKCRKIISIILIICAVIYFCYIQNSVWGLNLFSSLVGIRELLFLILSIFSSHQYVLLIKQLRKYSKQLVQQRVFDFKLLIFTILVYVIYNSIGFCLIFDSFYTQFICIFCATHSIFFMMFCERISQVLNDNFVALIGGLEKLCSHDQKGNSEEDIAFYEDFKPVPNAVDELQKIVDGYICISSCCDLYNDVFACGIQCCIGADFIFLIRSFAFLWLAIIGTGEKKLVSVDSDNAANVVIIHLVSQFVTFLLITALDSVRERVALLRCAVARFNNMLPEQGQLYTSTKYFLRLISKHPPQFGLVFELRASLIPSLVAQFVMFTIITIQFLGAL